MTNEELEVVFHDTEKELISRNLIVKRECSECASNLKAAEDAKIELDNVQKDLNDSINTLSVLRDELHNEFINYKLVIDESVSIRGELHDTRAKLAAVTAVVGGKEKNIKDAEEILEKAQDFEKQIITYTDGVDFNEFFAKINNGMINNNPIGKVENPVITDPSDNIQKPEGLSKAAKAVIERCKESIADNDIEQAKALFNKMKTKGVLSDSITWETISTANDTADE
jgi:seryl-tRNA synthetase